MFRILGVATSWFGVSSRVRMCTPSTLVKRSASLLNGHPLNCHAAPCTMTHATLRHSASLSLFALSMTRKRARDPSSKQCSSLISAGFAAPDCLSSTGEIHRFSRRSWETFQRLTAEVIAAGTTIVATGLGGLPAGVALAGGAALLLLPLPARGLEAEEEEGCGGGFAALLSRRAFCSSRSSAFCCALNASRM